MADSWLFLVISLISLQYLRKHDCKVLQSNTYFSCFLQNDVVIEPLTGILGRCSSFTDPKSVTALPTINIENAQFSYENSLSLDLNVTWQITSKDNWTIAVDTTFNSNGQISTYCMNISWSLPTQLVCHYENLGNTTWISSSMAAAGQTLALYNTSWLYSAISKTIDCPDVTQAAVITSTEASAVAAFVTYYWLACDKATNNTYTIIVNNAHSSNSILITKPTSNFVKLDQLKPYLLYTVKITRGSNVQLVLATTPSFMLNTLSPMIQQTTRSIAVDVSSTADPDPANNTLKIVVGIVVPFVVIVVALVALCCYCHNKGPSDDGELAMQKLGSEASPGEHGCSVLLLYAYDCIAHEQVVLSFANLLQSQWHLQVSLDIWDNKRFQDCTYQQWLNEKLICSSHIIIICSAGARFRCGRRREVHQLKLMRDVPDMFAESVDFVLERVRGSRFKTIGGVMVGGDQDLYNNMYTGSEHLQADVAKICTVTFPYSGPYDIPPKLDSEVHFHLPNELQELYCHLVSIPKFGRITREMDSATSPDTYHKGQAGRQLRTALLKAREYFLKNPAWFFDLFDRKGEEQNGKPSEETSNSPIHSTSHSRMSSATEHDLLLDTSEKKPWKPSSDKIERYLDDVVVHMSADKGRAKPKKDTTMRIEEDEEQEFESRLQDDLDSIFKFHSHPINKNYIGMSDTSDLTNNNNNKNVSPLQELFPMITRISSRKGKGKKRLNGINGHEFINHEFINPLAQDSCRANSAFHCDSAGDIYTVPMQRTDHCVHTYTAVILPEPMAISL